MSMRSPTQTKAESSFTPVQTGLLQRKCTSCSQHTLAGGECAECKNKQMPWQPHATNHAEPSEVPPIVGEVLRSPGQPLDPDTRNFMESGFGHDFSQVRIHTNLQANESAQAVNSKAYTVGRNVVFSAGQYVPETSVGKRLLAHELTHVVQQREQPSSIPMTSAISGFDDVLEDEADEIANRVVAGESVEVQGKVASPGTVYRSPLLPSNPITDRFMKRFLLQAMSLVASCDRTTPLTWADFSGRPPAQTRFSAETLFRHELIPVDTQQAVQAVFQPANSWVKQQFANPTDHALSGCGREVERCESFFEREAAAGRVGGSFNLAAPRECAASIAPNPSIVANSQSECNILGSECDRVSQLESQRLLRHEQAHYDIACKLARKGTLAILDGGLTETILRAVRVKSTEQTRLYDRQTQHGCNAQAQANWEADIQAGLPGVTIP